MNSSVRITKRIMDLSLSLLALFFTFPLLLLIALLIRLESEGPIFYMQNRINGLDETPDGKVNFKTFKMYKFRSMVNNAEAKTGAILAKKNDARVTRIGRFLRRTRLDELPQFLNVIKGEMSIVGPRPERPELLANLTDAVPFFEERIRNVKPGITGLAQINLSYSGKMDEKSPFFAMKDILTNPFELENAEDSLADDMRTKMLFDLAYAASLEKFSTFIWMDLKIMLKTPLVMLFGKGQ